MFKAITKNGKLNTLLLIIFLSLVLSLIISTVTAVPVGPSISVLSNTTKDETVRTKVNSTNGTNSPGGFIFTLGITSDQQNKRWKAYVGNVSGTLVLDNTDGESIFQWALGTVEGEIYATRASSTINWSGINCTWIADGRENKTFDMINLTRSNRTPEHMENKALLHTSKFDNVTATFSKRNHSQLQIGAITIGKDECYSIQTWQNDAAQVFPDSDNANFTQVILYDGAYNKSTGNVVYTTKIEDNLRGYDTTETYDFQMILPEVGTSGYQGSTAYYFYIELA